MSTIIAEPVVRELRVRAEQAAPQECCGALLSAYADAVVVERVLPLPNRAPDACAAYLIGAASVRRAERTAAQAGMVVVGFYHSHPRGTAQPSARDLAVAWPWYRYLIVAPDDMMLWRLRPDRGAFLRETVTTACAA